MRVNIIEEWTRLIECNITRNPNVTSNQIPTTILFLLRFIAKEDTGLTVRITLSSHEAGGQRKHNQKNEGGYTMAVDQKDAQVE
jgi:hypothetical protein